MKENFKSGFVTLIGRPNVGKSTLMNHLIGQKIAITSNKPQTTRNRIQTVLTTEEGQIVFVDTPGIHKAKNKLGEYMVNIAERSLNEVDVVLWLVEPSNFIGAGEKHIIDQLKKVKTPVILVINKIDMVKREEILAFIDTYRKEYDFAEIVPVSARTGDNTDELVKVILNYLPYGPQFYDEDTVTDQPERQIVAELIREKALHCLNEEIPHGIAVAIDQMKMNKKVCHIDATIICERDSHKGIIIGKQGSMLKISKDGQTYRYLVNNANFESFIKVVKKDAETGKTIPYAGAGFQIYDPSGNKVTMTFTYPAPTTIDTFYTDADGQLVTPEKLEYGKGYSLVEVQAPYGYVLDSTPVSFDVTEENATQEGTIKLVKVEKPNMAQKGTISVEKTGEVFFGVNVSGEEGKDVIYQPVYKIKGLTGATYEITADEDVVTPDGTLRYHKGDVVDTITKESAMRAVPEQYYEGALALGATHERSIFTVIIPAAKSGVIAGIVLGIGRAIGETMAVIMIVGNQPRLVSNMLLGMRTLTGNIVIEMGYATGLHREALIATGVVLFVFILIINFSVALLKRRGEHE